MENLINLIPIKEIELKWKFSPQRKHQTQRILLYI